MCVITIPCPCPYPNVNNPMKRLQNPNEILPCYTVSCTKEHVLPHSCVVGVQHADEEEIQHAIHGEVEPCSWCTSTATWTCSETRRRKRAAGAAQPDDDGQGGRKSRLKKIKLDEEEREDPACAEDYFATQAEDDSQGQCQDMAMDFAWTVPNDFDMLLTDGTDGTASESNFYNLPELGPITIEDILSGGGLEGDTEGIGDLFASTTNLGTLMDVPNEMDGSETHAEDSVAMIDTPNTFWTLLNLPDEVEDSETHAEDLVAMVDTPTSVESSTSAAKKPAAPAEWAFILPSPPGSPHRFPTPAIEPTADVAVTAADAEIKQRLDAVLLI